MAASIEIQHLPIPRRNLALQQHDMMMSHRRRSGLRSRSGKQSGPIPGKVETLVGKAKVLGESAATEPKGAAGGTASYDLIAVGVDRSGLRPRIECQTKQRGKQRDYEKVFYQVIPP